MAWDEATLRLEVLAELGGYASSHDEVEAVLGTRRARHLARCRENTRRRRLDPKLRAHDRSVTKEWRQRAKVVVDQVRCRCGVEFQVRRIDITHGEGPHACSTCRGIEHRGFVLYEINGTKKTATTWAKEHGRSPVTVHRRLRRGWPIEKALGL